MVLILYNALKLRKYDCAALKCYCGISWLLACVIFVAVF
jgi:hypothetical protein